MSRSSKELNEIVEMIGENRIKEEEFEEVVTSVDIIYDLEEQVSYITDVREQGYVLHSIESIIISVILAVFANCNTFTEIYLFLCKHFKWLDEHIKFENGIPSVSAIRRVVAVINPRELEEICNEILRKFIKRNTLIYKDRTIKINDIKSMDGKTANSSDRKKSKDGKVTKMNAMSIYSLKNEMCEATEFIKEKTNEIPTGIELLKRVNVEGSIIVFDAMSTQTKTIEYIANEKGYYVAPVKGNQKGLEENIKAYFEDEDFLKKAKKENYVCNIEKAHGTAETREYIFTNDIDWLAFKQNWKGIKSIGIAIRTYEKSGKEVKDIRYYISNLKAEYVKLISSAIRGEWSVENKLHYYLDMVFEEDKNKVFLGNSQKNLNIIRKFCLAILKIFKEKRKLSMNSLRFCINTDFENEMEDILKELCTSLF